MNQCPFCKGTGKIKPPSSRQKKMLGTPKLPSKSRIRLEQKTIMAKLLRKEGYTFQEIAGFLGYASKRSVQLCLAREL